MLLRSTTTPHLADGDQHAAVLRIAARRTSSDRRRGALVERGGAERRPNPLFVTMRAADVPSIGAALEQGGARAIDSLFARFVPLTAAISARGTRPS